VLLTTSSLPLVLDLDGTLIRTDTLHEMMARLLIKKPWLLFQVPFWFMKGRAFAKARLTDHIDLSPHHLPYNTELLTFAKSEAQKGRPLILATGTDQRMAQKIAEYLNIFQDVIGSDGHINMTGPRKQQALLERFGIHGFDYAGDSHIDIHVWQVARKALVVHPKRGVLKRVLALKGSEHTHCFS
jgi:phosphoserine phosphatase